MQAVTVITPYSRRVSQQDNMGSLNRNKVPSNMSNKRLQLGKFPVLGHWPLWWTALSGRAAWTLRDLSWT